MTFFLVSSAIKVFVVFNLIMVGVALLTLLERRVCAWMQDRLGPNRVGPQGILQPAADGLKNFLKEETSPAMADRTLFTLAPTLSVVPALLTFGLPDAEGELIAGYHTEYSSMKFSMFYIAEYSNMVTASALMATLFFGGWDIPFTSWDSTGDPSLVKTLATLAVFGLKTFVFLFTYIWVRWTLPRFRYDQLMALGWKVLLPLVLLYITLLAVAIWFVRIRLGWDYGPGMAWVLGGLNLVLLIVLAWWLDRGRIVSGSVPQEAA